MTEEIVGSHLKTFPGPGKQGKGYGQDGSSQSSSLLPGETKSPIANVSPPQTIVEGLRADDQLAHRVKMGADGRAAAYATHNGFTARTVDSGSPGGVIGSKTHHSPKR